MRITHLKDARAMQRIGMPLNTPVVECKFSDTAAGIVAALAKAHARFMTAVLKFQDGPPSGSVAKWRVLKRRFDALDAEVERSDAALLTLTGPEQELLVIFLFSRAEPFLRYWRAVIDLVDNGGEAVIHQDEVPVWYDE